jgi:hypothetical protein
MCAPCIHPLCLIFYHYSINPRKWHPP